MVGVLWWEGLQCWSYESDDMMGLALIMVGAAGAGEHVRDTGAFRWGRAWVCGVDHVKGSAEHVMGLVLIIARAAEKEHFRGTGVL